MLDVTWEWLGQGLALDLADTVNIVDGVENDLIEAEKDYIRWANEESRFLPAGSLPALLRGKDAILQLRTPLRQVVGAIAAGETPPRGALNAINRASSLAPTWTELDFASLEATNRSAASKVDRLLSLYARSAIELVASEGESLRRCPAPSCGMFYVRTRPQQTWCSTQCGTRARVARHYRKRHATIRSS
jgi:predicted RNA-binding Zn ribbon-like protein